MGFIVNHKVDNDIHGELDSFYVRIEMYRIDVINMKLFITVMCYTSKEGAITTHLDSRLTEHTGSKNISDVIFNGNHILLGNLSFFEFSLAKEVDIEQPVYETQTKTRTATLFDFDDDGNVIEKEGEEEYEEEVQIGTEVVTVKELDLTPITETSIFEFAYQKIKEEFGKVFGYESLIDLK